jgi:hypothetical protein
VDNSTVSKSFFGFLETNENKEIPFLLKLKYFPERMVEHPVFHGNIDLDGYKTDISLPDNLTVFGNVNMDFSNITKLPNNLTIDGFLSIENTKIRILPVNLTVRQQFFIGGSYLERLYSNWEINEFVTLSSEKDINRDISLPF